MTERTLKVTVDGPELGGDTTLAEVEEIARRWCRRHGVPHTAKVGPVVLGFKWCYFEVSWTTPTSPTESMALTLQETL